MPGQLVFPFGVEPALGREDFILAPCNEQAVQFIRRWPDWPMPTAALYGPAHSGKTHLAAIWRKMADADIDRSGQSARRRERNAFEPKRHAHDFDEHD